MKNSFRARRFFFPFCMKAREKNVLREPVVKSEREISCPHAIYTHSTQELAESAKRAHCGAAQRRMCVEKTGDEKVGRVWKKEKYEMAIWSLNTRPRALRKRKKRTDCRI